MLQIPKIHCLESQVMVKFRIPVFPDIGLKIQSKVKVYRCRHMERTLTR